MDLPAKSEAGDTAPVRHRPRWLRFLRRHPYWLALIATVVAIRVALPYGLRPFLESQASSAMRGHVQLGGIDLWLLLGGVALDDVRLLPEEGSEKPILAWRRIYAQISWLDLAKRAIVIRELRLDQPFIDVERLASGDINLAEALAPPPATAEPPPAKSTEAADGPSWTFALDRLIIDAGGVQFQDFSAADAEAIELDVKELHVQRATFDHGTYEEAAELRIDATLSGAPLSARIEFTPLVDGHSIHGEMRVVGLPLRHGLPYLAALPWQQLAGTLDLDLRYDSEGTEKHGIAGTISLREVAVHVADLAEPALAWNTLDVTVGGADLLRRHAQVASISLDGLSLAVDPLAPQPLPLLRGAAAMTSTDADPDVDPEADENPDEAPAPGAASEDADETPPWSWEVATVRLTNATVRAESRGAPLALAVAIDADGLSSEPGNLATGKVGLQLGEGSAAIDGTFRLEPAGFKGRFEWKDLDLPPLFAATPPSPTDLVESAVTSGTLELRGGLAGDAAAGGDIPVGELQVAGDVDLRDLRVVGDDPRDFSLAWRRLAVDLADVRLPLPPRDGAICVALGSVDLDRPIAHLTRSDGGILLPVAGAPGTANDTTESDAAAQASQGSNAAPAITVEIERLALKGGVVDFTDRTLTAPFSEVFADINGSAAEFRWPSAPHFREFDISMLGPEGEPLSVRGIERDGTVEIDTDVGGLLLPVYDTYSRHYSGYSVRRGDLLVESRLRWSGERYDSKNKITLRDLDIGAESGDHLFQDTFGVPITLALALLRDPKGQITFDVPVGGTAAGTELDLVTTVRTTLQRTIVNALTSPLKLLGSVNILGGAVTSVAIEPIPFKPGRVDFAKNADTRLGHLAQLLDDRPGLGLALAPRIAASDRAWLAERRLIADLAAQRELAFVADTPKKVRAAINEHLDKIGTGKKSKLKGDAAAVYRELCERTEVSSIRLTALASARIARVVEALAEQHDIDGNRVDATPYVEGELSSEPMVAVGLGVAAGDDAPTTTATAGVDVAAPPS